MDGWMRLRRKLREDGASSRRPRASSEELAVAFDRYRDTLTRLALFLTGRSDLAQSCVIEASIVGQYSLVQCALPLQAAGNRPGHVQSEKFCKAFAAEHLCRRRCAVTLSWSNYTSIIEVYRSKWQLL
jgi:hypothetical protein